MASSKYVQGRADDLPRNLPSLTGMRFIAAALVFFSHVVPGTAMFASARTTKVFDTLFDRAGFVGVGFFFILSGFVLTWSVRTTDTAPKFWRRRFFKIYPNHLVTFVAALLLAALYAHQATNHGYAVINLLLLHSWFPSLNYIVANPVAWSLSCELLFYLSFPLVVRAVNRIRPDRLWHWVGGIMAVVCIIPVIAYAMPAAERLPWLPVTTSQLWFIFMFPPVRMLDFVLGIVLARIVITRRRAPLSLRGSVVLAVVVYALTPVLPNTFEVVATMVIPLSLIIMAGAVADIERRPNALSSRVGVWLGEVSFAFYMVHFLVLAYGYYFITGGTLLATPAALGLIAVLFGAAVVAAWLLYSVVERPTMRRFASSRRRRPTLVPQPQPADVEQRPAA